MKKILFAVMCLLLPFAVFSQFFIATDLGYAVSTDKTKFYNIDIISVDDRINDVYNVEKIPIKFSIVQSPFVNIIGGYKLKKWEVSLGFSYCDNKTLPGFNKNNSYLRDKSIIWSNDGDDRILEAKSIENYSFYTKGYYLFPEVSYRFAIKHIIIQPLLGVSFKFLKVYETVTKESATYDRNSSAEDSPNYVTQRYNYKSSFSSNLNNMFALWSGLQILYNINDNLDLSCKIKCSLGNSYRVVEKVQTLYEQEFLGNVVESDNTEYIYPTDRLFDANTLNFSFGIRYYFNKKDTADKDE